MRHPLLSPAWTPPPVDHTAALLVHMAVQGAVRIQSTPLVAGRRRPGFFLDHTILVWGFVVAALASVPLISKVMPGLLDPYGTAILYGTLIGCVAGMNTFRAPGPRWGLRPRATALRDQVEGFRHYIATAEADQLNFEVDQDVAGQHCAVRRFGILLEQRWIGQLLRLFQQFIRRWRWRDELQELVTALFCRGGASWYLRL